MRITSPKIIAVIGALTAIIAPGPGRAADDHIVLTPNDVKWMPGPASIPQGAQVAVLYGDPSKDGSFALRLKMPAGYHVPRTPIRNPKWSPFSQEPYTSATEQ